MQHLYLHVPFCVRRCSYCDFSIAVRKRIPGQEYVETILNELTRVGSPAAVPRGKPNPPPVLLDQGWGMVPLDQGWGMAPLDQGPRLMVRFPRGVAPGLPTLRRSPRSTSGAARPRSSRPKRSRDCYPNSPPHAARHTLNVKSPSRPIPKTSPPTPHGPGAPPV